jgi:hypothetical protein
MNIAYFPNQLAQNGQPVLDAFLSSCRHAGHTVTADSTTADAAVIWSQVWAGKMRGNQQVWQEYTQTGRPVVVLEVGNLNRNTTWRVGLNGINSFECFGATGQGPERAQKLGLTARPWTHQGDHVVICTQRGDSEQWAGQPTPEIWAGEVIKQTQQHTDRPIVIRPHPRFRFRQSWPGVEIHKPVPVPGTYDSYNFDQALYNAWAVVNWNSGPGIESAIKGVPVFTSPVSLSAPVGNFELANIEKPLRPERQQWLNDLAYTEWTVEEIKQGLPLNRLLSA